jgi:Histidine phosphatase superfamily (branch 1)
MRSNHFRRWWLNLGLVVLLVACNVPTPPIISQPGTTTTIIMVRHAERDPGTDPPLNAEGQARAQSLANVLGQNGVTAIYTVDYIRNRQTVQPLADKLGLTPAIVDVTQLADTKTLAKVLVNEWLTKHAGGVVLWVGNVGAPALGTNGTLEDIYRLLGGTGTAPNRYQDLTIIVVPEQGKGNPRFVRTTYGGPSTLDPVTP